MIESSWTIQDVILNIEALKSFYLTSSASFSYFDKHSMLKFKYSFKKSIYSLNMTESQKDKIWQYINGDELDEPLEYLIKKRK